MPRTAAAELPLLECKSHRVWATWLAKHHGASAGVWLRMAKKASGIVSISHPEALETALCYGWIDGQSKSEGASHFRQKFLPRAKRSIWSRINREKALALIERGAMQAAGLAEVERAKADGRWDAAYEPPSTSVVPPDLAAAFKANPKAKAFFATVNSQNRYAVLFRIQTAKKPETRAKRIATFVAMLARHETLHP